MASALPKLKPDLQVQAQTVEGVNYFVVKEATGGKFIRLREPEYFLLQHLDGESSPEATAEQFVRNFHRTI
ncbi:MAG: hypothetical protein ABIJ61_01090, partial [bacterium]